LKSQFLSLNLNEFVLNIVIAQIIALKRVVHFVL
jgi:hypothetical protein